MIDHLLNFYWTCLFLACLYVIVLVAKTALNTMLTTLVYYSEVTLISSRLVALVDEYNEEEFNIYYPDIDFPDLVILRSMLSDLDFHIHILKITNIVNLEHNVVQYKIFVEALRTRKEIQC